MDVLTAAKERIKSQLADFPDYYVSFSGGKDSGVLLQLVVEAASELGLLPAKVVFSDLEAIFVETERYVHSIMEMPEVEPYWLCIEEVEDNASSVYERYYRSWDASKKDKWVREMPKMPYVLHAGNMPDGLKKYITGNVNEWSITGFGEYLCDKSGVDRILNFIGMRQDESYGRYMAVASAKNRIKKNAYTYLTKNSASRTWTCLPIYDWQTPDVWHYYASNGFDYNRVYDKMYRLGIPMSEMRTCFAFGEAQKKSLWQWKAIEPETFDRLLNRVEGVNFGAMYNHTSLNRNKITLPSGSTWKQYLDVLLAGLPPMIKEHFEGKFSQVFRYHDVMYAQKGIISASDYIQDSRKAAREKAKEMGLGIKHFISYETLCWAIIKRDFVFERYGFGYSQKTNSKIKEICDAPQS